MLERLGDDDAVGEDLEEPLGEVVDLVAERPRVGEHDEGQGGGQHHHAGLVHLQHQGLTKAGLLGAGTTVGSLSVRASSSVLYSVSSLWVELVLLIESAPSHWKIPLVLEL